MVKVHRQLLGRLGDRARAAAIDTPVGFQENADEIAARAVEYFRVSVGADLRVASFRDAEISSPLETERALKEIREATYVFAGPGSPTYALRQWRKSPIPDLLREKLQTGGCLTFASAAALTLGAFTVPVYEIYKVGAPVRWENGLDLMAEAGLSVAVIPHFNNKEGGTHDTRYCYLGQKRLELLEDQLPKESFVLGIDEHTACIIDLDDRSVEVLGIGALTVRRSGSIRRFASGTTLSVDDLTDVSGQAEGQISADTEPITVAEHDPAPFWDGVEARQTAFDDALSENRVDDAADELLGLDTYLWQWSTETFGTDEMERARAQIRQMIVSLVEFARRGARDDQEMLEPYIEALVALRDRARAEGRFEDADEVRDALSRGGVELHDRTNGTSWKLKRSPR